MQTAVLADVSAPAATRITIAGIGTAVPPLEMTQAEALAYILEHFHIRPATKSLYRRVMGHPSIATRRFAMDDPAESLEEDLDRIHARYQRWAVRLGAEALRRALAAAGVEAGRLDGLVTVTCTGTLCPGLSSHLAEACGLPAALAAADLVGMGCGAAVPGLRQAAAMARANPGAVTAVVCVEICTAALFDGDAADLVITNSIFGDGAAAAVLRAEGADGGGGAPVAAGETASVTVPEWRDSLRFRTEGGRLRNMLGREVPAQAAKILPPLVDGLLRGRGLGRDAVRRWLLHPGGATVLDALRDALALDEPALASSRAVLRRHGNMSSPSVLFVLSEELAARPPAGRELAVLASFGAGFSAHAMLLDLG